MENKNYDEVTEYNEIELSKIIKVIKINIKKILLICVASLILFAAGGFALRYLDNKDSVVVYAATKDIIPIIVAEKKVTKYEFISPSGDVLGNKIVYLENMDDTTSLIADLANIYAGIIDGIISNAVLVANLEDILGNGHLQKTSEIAEAIQSKELAEYINKTKLLTDMIIVDVIPIKESMNCIANDFSEGLIIVTETEKHRIDEIEKYHDGIDMIGANLLGLIVYENV